MKLIRFFSHSDVKAFGRDLAQKLSKEIPPVLMENRRKVLSVNKITRLLENIYQTASDYQRDHRIGFIKRAVLVNNFKWELKNGKYPDDFVDMATEGLVVGLSKANAMPKTGK